MSSQNNSPVFDYRALRLLVGLIALILPIAVSLLATEFLPSISFSYHTDAHDAFVGMLFIIGAFLWAYNGHTLKEGIASKIAALSAFFIAIFPTACESCLSSLDSYLHSGASAILFSILAYFCLGPFRLNTKGKSGKKGLRGKIYFYCGWIMVGCILAIGVGNIALDPEKAAALQLTYWAETIALMSFGIAWIVAGKTIPFLVDDKDAFRLLK